MHWVVFLRAANVGKHNRFQPSVLAQELAKLGVINVGAVGTFVIRENVTETALRAAILGQLPFKCEVMVRRAKEIVDLVGTARFEDEALDSDQRPFVTVMGEAPARLPKLPIYAPSLEDWEVKIVQITGACVLSLWRRSKRNTLYPNQVIEKKFGVATTTRSWTTILKVSALLGNSSR
jgi:uncharacterized protein (DUF1697 family)